MELINFYLVYGMIWYFNENDNNNNNKNNGINDGM